MLFSRGIRRGNQRRNQRLIYELYEHQSDEIDRLVGEAALQVVRT
jgi:hypothetical protein